MQPVHIVFHILELLFSGAVACIILSGEFIQIFCIAFQGIAWREFGEMETADQDIRTEPVGNIHDSPMGAAAEKYFLMVLFQKQILLMAEIFRKKYIVLKFGKPEISRKMFLFFFAAGIEGCPFREEGGAFCEDQTVMPGKGSIQADVFFGAVIMGLEGVAAQIDRSLPVYFQKSGKTAAVVVVSMGKDGQIHGFKIDAERGGIFREELGLAHIKENLMACSFDVQAQSVFGGHIRAFCRIFKQGCDLHVLYSSRFSRD